MASAEEQRVKLRRFLLPSLTGHSGKFLRLVNGCLAWATVETNSSGLTDGDYGDITVGGSPTQFTINDGVVTLAKLANVETGSLFYRKTAGEGPPEVQTLATLKADLSVDDAGASAAALASANNYTDSKVSSLSSSVTEALSGKANSLGADENYVTGAEKTKLSNLSGTNTGDETGAGIRTKLGTTTVGAALNTLTNPSAITFIRVNVDNSVSTLDAAAFRSAIGAQDALTNGYGISGTTTKAIALTTASAFITAETTLSAATYADITGASVSLAAGTWLILATINGSSQTTTATTLMVAITDGSNNVVCEGSQHIVAGTATVRTWGNVKLTAIVSPGATTTYKLRGARGTTTTTGNCIVSDGNGVNTANNVSNNSDKGTGIFAVRLS